MKQMVMKYIMDLSKNNMAIPKKDGMINEFKYNDRIIKNARDLKIRDYLQLVERNRFLLRIIGNQKQRQR